MKGPPAWAADYVGLLFAEKGRKREGLDCWGLARLVLAERFGIDVPSYLDRFDTTTEGLRLSALIEREAADWEEVVPGFELAGDCVLRRMAGLPFHVGIVVAPGHMLHIEDGLDSTCERYARP